MRTEPTWRIPVGVLGLLAGLLVYTGLVALVAPPLIGEWPALAQGVVYLALGLIWLLPLRRFLIWMETGRWG
ncbi:DUF2842 domain-containing protein [Erythrobacter arachoides]|uniref:DUF2842 domain-containing protein n=1 Tax=Aurantiacibacter arachoides TaxID=1850444 RepID=A0A844ZYX1_9SPHN|nr:DUF2842 domain-containing protein [Aurantiacibacter arachoides]MXO93363.1 DUF2842 domain-containing protein [Aurantiacibacter arachoides]GGD49961.1 hypothetical protein GCM10011411_07190 [Aurantiacibacter arachoides]